MSRNGSGVYSLPAGNPVVTGTTISSTWANTTLSDIATALTGSVAADGQTAMTGNLQMGNNKITGLAVATASGDALSYGQAATISALTVSGAFAANGGATLGDASGDALTINSSAVSIPNGLNFDSNTLVIDATNNRVGVGVASPAERFDVNGNIQVGYTSSGQYVDVYNGDTTNYQRLRLSMSGNNAFITTRRSGGTVPQMLFGIDNTEVMRIDSSGNVGIGTSSPVYRLDVRDVNKTGNSSNQVIFTTTAQAAGIGGTLGLGGLYDSSNSTMFGVVRGGKENSTSGNYAGFLSFETVSNGSSITERMRIDSSGNLLVGTTSLGGSGGVSIAKNGNGANSSGVVLFNATSNDNYPVIFRYNGSDLGYIRYTNTTVSYVNLSDYRLKENIAPMTGALAKVQSLKPCTYTWKADGSAGQGFIAHELAEVVPDAVTGEKDAVNEDGSIKPQGIDTSFLVATLTAAIQEQQAIITDLKARIETLENK